MFSVALQKNVGLDCIEGGEWSETGGKQVSGEEISHQNVKKSPR